MRQHTTTIAPEGPQPPHTRYAWYCQLPCNAFGCGYDSATTARVFAASHERIANAHNTQTCRHCRAVRRRQEAR